MNGEILVARPPEVSQQNEESLPQDSEQPRIAQLEQNIKFLQEQHQVMLTGLHNEIEVLKIRNRGKKIFFIFNLAKITCLLNH